MKTGITTLLRAGLMMLAILVFTSDIVAQNAVPNGMNYQAVARDDAGNVMAFKTIKVKISIAGGSATSAPQYAETHTVTTNAVGMFTITIGSGTAVAGEFKDIPWTQANQWLVVEMDPEGGNQFMTMGATQLLSVPYAFHALTADQLTDGTVQAGTGGTRVDPNDWTNTGNSGLTAGTNFMGTTDNVDVVFKANNSEVVRMKSGGNVGIGTSTPSEKLHLAETTHGADIRLFMTAETDGGTTKTAQIGYDPDKDFMYFRNGGRKGIGLDANGQVGIGTTLPQELLHLRSGANGDDLLIKLTALNNSGTGKHGFIGFDPDDNMVYLKKGSTRGIEINSSANVGIGDPSTISYKLHVNGTFKSNGITESSDARWKKNVDPLSDPLDKVLALRGVTYEWKTEEFADRNFKEGTQYGFIAQEVEKIIPEVVSTDLEGYKSVQYSKIVPVLVEAIKAQQKIIDEQRATIGANSAQLIKLQQQVDTMVNFLNATGIGTPEQLQAETK